MTRTGRPVRAAFVRLALATALAAAAICPEAFAEEAAFGFTYMTDLLPKGAKEVEQWATWRFTKIAGTYDEIQARTQFESGLTDRLQVSAYRRRVKFAYYS